jgi:hypothetical protein
MIAILYADLMQEYCVGIFLIRGCFGFCIQAMRPLIMSQIFCGFIPPPPKQMSEYYNNLG